MKLGALVFAAGAAASAVLDKPLVAHDNKIDLFADNHPHHAAVDTALRRIPTAAESAVQARRILAMTHFGTISTVFPRDDALHADDARPPGLGGVAVGLPEYLADCEDHSGNPTLLAITIATSFRNARAGSNVSIALQWVPPHFSDQRLSLLGGVQALWRRLRRDNPATAAAPYSAAALPRFSLFGYLEPITGQDDHDSPLAKCYVASHPDARWWLPGSGVHKSEWLRLVVTEVYWIGGFGDRAYIGWIPVEDWKNVTRDDWESVRLPGEDSWRESDL